MLGGVVGRHLSGRRRDSSPLPPMPPGSPRYRRRRRAVTTSDHKTCALIQTRLKLGDIMWVSPSSAHLLQNHLNEEGVPVGKIHRPYNLALNAGLQCLRNLLACYYLRLGILRSSITTTWSVNYIHLFGWRKCIVKKNASKIIPPCMFKIYNQSWLQDDGKRRCFYLGKTINHDSTVRQTIYITRIDKLWRFVCVLLRNVFRFLWERFNCVKTLQSRRTET